MRHFLKYAIVLVAVWLVAGPGLLHSQPIPMINIVHSLPPQAPPWLEGYQVRWPVRVIGEPVQQADAQTVLVSLPTGGWLKPDAADLAVQTGSGKLMPLAVLSHDPAGETIVQFKRNGNDPWYWIYGVHPKSTGGPRADVKTDPAFREGITLELRDWEGDDLKTWVAVRAGLEKSSKVIGNAIVTEVIQNTNAARPDQPLKFAASFRGFFNVKKAGVYSFVVNADDASFLFIDGFKVFERPGNNITLGTIKLKDLEKVAGKVELKPGVHAFEVHQAVGNSPQAAGRCALVWTTPDQPKFSFVPLSAMAHPLYARTAAAELASGSPAGNFAQGIDDSLDSFGLKLFLVRFEADGRFKEPAKIQWDFGDGNTGTGPSVTHSYFKEGDYLVTMNAGAGLPPFRRRIRIWPEPGDSSPLSLELAVKVLDKMDWKKLDLNRLRQIFAFLQICEQPNRWPLMEAVTQHLLAQKDLDLEVRNQIITARMEALTQLNRAAEALKLAEQSMAEFAKTPVLQVRLQLSVALIHQYHYKDGKEASKIYRDIIEEHKRVEHPNLRVAGIRWGDLYAETGDLARASETYRIAATLGGEKFAGTAQTEATTRGALMRIAEQKLKSGETHATRQLLERIELDYPGRRLDGLYCFLRAETDRSAGRYEDALRHYEMIFKLPQWAGYRDRAMFGMADIFFRMNDFEESSKWYQSLKKTYPKMYEAQKGAIVEKLIEERLGRIKAAKSKGDAFFPGYSTGFEPDEKEWFGNNLNATFTFVRAPGLQGPHAALMDVYPRELATFEYHRPLKNLTPGGTYWVEIWYRDVLRQHPPGAYLHVYLESETPVKESVLATGQYHVRNSFHQWHKMSFKLKAPLAHDCKLKILFHNHSGAFLYDSLSIRPVSDRQLEGLTNFLEGKAP